MARNKPPKPLTEAPPEPDSSDNDENSSSSSTEVEEEPEQQAQGGEVSSSSASSDEEEREPQQQTPKKPQSTTTKKPTNDSSDEEEEDDDSPVLKSKSITSPSKSTSKPRSKPNVVALTAEKEKDKRPLEIEEKDKEKGVASKKPRKEKEKEKEKSTVVVQEEGAKKQASVPFQRLYSEDDEIAILKGMIEYRSKKGADPMLGVDDFYEFIKNSLHVDVNRGQFVDKIRRLKKRYYNSLDKKKKLTNPHEIKFFELCQKIWNNSDEKVGNGAVENSNLSAKSNSKARVLKIKNAGNGPAVEEQKTKVEEEKEEKEKDWKISECDEKDVEMEIGEDASKERLRKKGLKLIGVKARAEISEMWDKVVMAQREVDELRYNVLKEENRRIMEALKSGKQ